ncbi:molybdate ABC transporter permease subunit [Peribacillus loiseleuriae]|uniref:molybdate ABC transporter permease subunit n=1 Tax=Peribacillus loiseleuriae TaxID=1679170 RepID=UPI003801E568
MNQDYFFPIQLSLVVAFAAALAAFITGVILGKVFAVQSFKGKILLETMLMLPLVLPPSVIGFLLILIFGAKSPIGQLIEAFTGGTILFTPLAAIIAASVVAFPLMFQSAKAGFTAVDKDIEGAAKVDGASTWAVLVKISIPLASKSLIAGGVLSFTRALGEFGATLMFAGNLPGKTQTIPTMIYIAVESGNTKLAFSYVLFSITLAFILLGLIQIINNRNEL